MSEQLMAKVLKESHETTFKGEPIILKPLKWSQDLVVTAMMGEFTLEASKAGIQEEMLQHGSNIILITITMGYSMHKKNDKGKIVPYFNNMNEAKAIAGDEAAWRDMVRLYGEYAEAFIITEREKKS